MPIYMKVPGLEGPVKGKYKGWIELKSCQLGVRRSVRTATGQAVNREASTPSMTEIVVTKSLDNASTDLQRLAAWGEGKTIQIVFVAKDSKNEVPYLCVVLENTLISNYSVGGSGGDADGGPLEALTLDCVKVTYSTDATEASKDPKHLIDRVSWDLATVRGA